MTNIAVENLIKTMTILQDVNTLDKDQRDESWQNILIILLIYYEVMVSMMYFLAYILNIHVNI